MILECTLPNSIYIQGSFLSDLLSLREADVVGAAS